MFLALLLLAAAADPDVTRAAGETHRTIELPSAAARRGDGRPRLDVVVWYPAARGSIETPYRIGPPDKPLFEVADLAQEARPETGRHPVVLLSHGFGGSADDMGWLAAPLARAGFLVISVDHPGNNSADGTIAGAVSWWERPLDMIAALDAISRDPVMGALMDRGRVGAGGFSMGASTALALAGARVDPMHFAIFCRAHPRDTACLPPPEMPTASAADIEPVLARLGWTGAADNVAGRTRLPRLRAVLAIAPNVQILTDESLRSIRVPVTFVAGSLDQMVPIDRHAGLAATYIRGAQLVRVPTATHYSFLSSCTDAGRSMIAVCRMAADQGRAHAVAIREALLLFRRTLLPERLRRGAQAADPN